MWIIKTDTAKADKYIKLFWKYHPGYFKKDGYKSHMTNLQTTYVYKTINKSVFERYLKAQPLDLIKMHNDLFKVIYDGKHNIDEEKEALKRIFNYESAIDDMTDFSYEVATLMETNTCTYCNRQYTLTINENDSHIIRPQFDHWFPQSKYLDFTLSYFNLIPACSLCNSTLKHGKSMTLKKYIHPYVDNDIGFRFDYHTIGKDKDGIEHYQVDCQVESCSKKQQKRIRKTLDLFRIEEIYSAHEGLELRDLVELARANPHDYISNLIKKVLADTNMNEEDAYRLLFGIETQKENYAKRPFSKFKIDIINKLKEQMK